MLACKNQCAARDSNDSLSWSAAGPVRKVFGVFGDVSANHGEIAIFQFEDVWATLASGACQMFCGRRAKSSNEHTAHVTIVASIVKLTFVYG
jgi:hypothetical protein